MCAHSLRPYQAKYLETHRSAAARRVVAVPCLTCSTNQNVIIEQNRNKSSSIRFVAVARAELKDLQIIARDKARNARHAAHLYRMGVSHAVPETIEASLQRSEAALVDVGVALGPVIASIHEKRSEFQAQIQGHSPRRHLRDVKTETD